jgi:glycolate oxidase FAD binding subunit
MREPLRYTPTSAGEVQEIVTQAIAEKRGLEIAGGGSKRVMRGAVLAQARLELGAVTGIADYDSDELVLTAWAGTPLAEIEAALGERRQMLAFEPFDHGFFLGESLGRATLGGVVAANVSGSRRIASGAARDHILGFTAVTGGGETIKGGGAVVKNVTGFDLPKLIAGSWGTLAVLVSLTMRVLPRPRTQATLLFEGLTARAANELMGKALATPAAVSGAAHLQSITALRLEGFGPSVAARSRQLLGVLAPLCAGGVEIGADESALFWRDVHSLETLPKTRHALFRISVPPARGWEVEARLALAAAEYAYDWGGALVWAAIPAERAGGAREHIREIARSLGGHAQLVRAAEESAETGASGEAPRRATNGRSGLDRLHERLKSTFDPAGILNPGLDLTAHL